MLRLLNNFKSLPITTEAINNTNLQIRWHRKPRWLPVAKSKVFRIPKRPEQNEEEYREMQRLFNNYRTQIKSIRRFLTYKYCTHMQASLDPETIKQEFEEDFERCKKINDEWNAKQKMLREERVSKEFEAEVEKVKARIERINLLNIEKQEFADEIVRKVKEEAKTFITRENIDEAIEKALAEIVDYNFALDVKGEKIIGRDTKLPEEKVAVKQ